MHSFSYDTLGILGTSIHALPVARGAMTGTICSSEMHWQALRSPLHAVAEHGADVMHQGSLAEQLAADIQAAGK
jgi:hypothetical protein